MTTVAVLQRGFVSPKLAPRVAERAQPRLVSRASAERRSERNETRDPAQNSRAQYGLPAAIRRVAPRSRVSLRSPGTREERAKSRRAKRTVGRHSRFTMSNSAVLFVPAARCCARVCASLRMCLRFRVRRRAHGGFGASGRRDSSNSVPPMRGGWSADRRTLSFGRACDARPPCPGATGTPLGAPPWRFSDADPRSRLPAVEPEPAATARARP